MPRKKRASAKQVHQSRRDWYVYHYENRQTIKALPPSMYQKYLYVTSMVEPPQMTVFGGLASDYPERQVYELAAKYGLDVNLINSWYLTDDGWACFQALWQALPEPTDLYTDACVQIGELYTLYTLPAEAEVR